MRQDGSDFSSNHGGTLLDPQLATPIFSAIYQRYCREPRIEQVKRLAVPPTRSEFFGTLQPAGYPLLFSVPTIQKLPLIDALILMRQNSEGVQIKARQSTYLSSNEYLGGRQQVPMLLSDYLDDLLSPSGIGLYAGNQPLPPRFGELFGASLPDFLNEDQMEPPAFWLGPAGSITPLHKDSIDNFAIQLFGEKLWTLYPGRVIPFLAMSRPNLNEEADFAVSALNWLFPDTEQFPEFHNAQSITVLRPGDVLYLPAGWAHQVQNQTPCLMMNYWMKRESYRQLIGV